MPQATRWLAAVLLAGLFSAGCQTSRPAGNRSAVESATTLPSSAATPRQDVLGLPNFAEVADGVYRGAQPTAEGFAHLKEMGIKTVVNLRAITSDRPLLAGKGLNYVHLHSEAWHPEDENVLQFLKIVEDPANRPVFVHCQHGADRTGCAIAVYRIVEQGWTTEQAIAEMHHFGFHPMWTQIIDYLERFDTAKAKRELRHTKPPTIDKVD